jgi:hypothetical protein
MSDKLFLKDIPPGTVIKRADSANHAIYYMCVAPHVSFLKNTDEDTMHRPMRLDTFEVLGSKAWLQVPFEKVDAKITIIDPTHKPPKLYNV